MICLLPAETRRNVDAVGRLLNLPEPEKICLAFLLLLATEPQLTRAASCLGHSLDDRSADEAVARATGLPRHEVSLALSARGRLGSCQLIKRDRNGHMLSGKFDWASSSFADQMREEGFDPIRALRDRVVPAPASAMTWSQFSHLGKLGATLKTYLGEALRKRTGGVNILLWGDPGTGKTQLVRTLAADLKAELYEVSTEDNDGDPICPAARLQALRLSQEFTSQRPAFIIFDEIEDIIARPGSSIGVGPRGPAIKGWLNRMLETNATITFWVTNSVLTLDPAYVRRFDLVVEMKALPQNARAAQLQALPIALSDATVHRLVTCQEVTPGVVQRAASVVQAVTAVTPDVEPSEQLELLVNQTLRAQGHAGLPVTSGLPEVYDRRFIHADVDPDMLVEGVRSARAGRLCLFGPPGTGKTAFAHHLAREVGLSLRVCRASDLLSPYVGMAEKQIAAAFREAAESGAALLMDEVDSFLQDRTQATRSWEITQVNEFLTQLEVFSGVFIASTNLMGNLDPAALRRFDFKARFDYLKPAQAEALLAAHLQQGGLPPVSSADVARLGALDVLTPGDFAVIARQQRFRAMTSAAQWIDGLAAECARKPGRSRPSIGFGGGAA
jgi:SpoVK/Ycf46/Vps4 family AAA+-type ATPase